MLRDEPSMLSPERERTHPAAMEIGRILSERFLIERETTHSGDLFRTYVAKDLKNDCVRVFLRSCGQAAHGDENDFGSYEKVCAKLIGLDHPNVEEIIEAGKLFDGRPYSISRYFEGDRLSGVLNGGKRLTIEQTARVIEAVYDGVSAVHDRRILHCAIAPSNILISDLDRPNESIRLINFGTAWPVGICSLQTGEMALEDDTRFFAAPETLVKLGHRSQASDVYSLAALAYRMLVGKPPYRTTNANELLESIASLKIEVPSDLRTDLSRETERILLSALSPESAWRPQNIYDFGSRLVLSLRGTSAPPRRSNGKAAEPEPIEIPATDKITAFVEETVPLESYLTPPRRLTRVHNRPPTAFSDRAVTYSLILLLLAGALSIPIGRLFWNDMAKASTVGTMLPKAPEVNNRRELRFSIDPSGDGVRRAVPTTKRVLSLTSDVPGEIYVIEETSTDESPIAFRVVSSTSAITPGKPMITDLADGKELPGLKAIWIVCAAAKNGEIESLKTAGSSSSPEEMRKMKHFLERNKNLRVDVASDDATGQTVLNGTGERIVHRIAVQSEQPDPALTAQK